MPATTTPLAPVPGAPGAMPGLNIPLVGAAPGAGGTAGTPGAPAGLNIPIGGASLGPGGTSIALPALPTGAASAASAREARVVRAVAAATALHKPAEALKAAEEAKKGPSKAAVPVIPQGHLDAVLGAVDRALADPSIDPPPSAEEIAAARAVGVEPALVAAAKRAMDNDAAAAGRAWVAAINPQRLEDAGFAVARSTQLKLVPQPGGEKPEIEKRLKKLEEDVQELRSDVDLLKKQQP